MKTSLKLMRIAYRIRIIFYTFLFTLLCASMLSAQTPLPRRQSQADQPIAVVQGQSTIHGRVVYEDTGRPAKKARVSLFLSEDFGMPQPPRFAMTDEQGEFRFENLGAGQYQVSAQGAGALSPNMMATTVLLPAGARPEFSSVRKDGARVSLDGANTAEVELRIPRTGSVTGKILQANGEPAANVRVNFLLRDEKNGRTMGFTQRSVTTDKNGNYKAEGLPTGEYVVSAAIENPRLKASPDFRNDIRARARGENLIPTFYPSATTIQNAETVRVEPEHETSGINIQLIDRGTYTVSGAVIIKSTGEPMAGAIVALRNKDESAAQMGPAAMNRTARTDAQGRFSFENVMDGSYALSAIPGPERVDANALEVPPTPTTAQPTRPELRASVELSSSYRMMSRKYSARPHDVMITGGDAFLTIEMLETATISGSVGVEGNAAPPRTVHLYVESANVPGALVRVPADVKPDGTFTIQGVPAGNVYLRATAGPVKYYQKSVTVGGTDFTNDPLAVDAGAQITGVRITLSTEVATLSGHVTSQQTGAPVGNTLIMLTPADPKKQNAPSFYLFIRVGADGAYTASCAPGDYIVIVLRPGENPPMPAPSEEFIRRYSASAPRISLRPSENKSLDLIVPSGR